MFSFLNNIPNVTKNLLILNVLFFIVTMVLKTKDIDLIPMLGAHYINSPLFQPYQIVTHFFMHSSAGIGHIFFNMFALVMFGSLLEKLWGPKRFFVFYIASALGAFALYNIMGMYEIAQLKNQLAQMGYSAAELNNYLVAGIDFAWKPQDVPVLVQYFDKCLTPMVGASGAIFGIMAGFAYLFPNTELMMMFIPFPIKAKYLVGGYFAIELYLSFRTMQGDTTAHLAHVGGAIVGFILVFIWNRNKKSFY